MKEKKRKCNHCGSEVKFKKGISNWKNLFRKPTLDEWITLFIIIMVILSSYAYRHDVDELNKFYTEGDYCTQELELKQQEIKGDEAMPGETFNLSGINFEDE